MELAPESRSCFWLVTFIVTLLFSYLHSESKLTEFDSGVALTAYQPHWQYIFFELHNVCSRCVVIVVVELFSATRFSTSVRQPSSSSRFKWFFTLAFTNVFHPFLSSVPFITVVVGRRESGQFVIR